MKNTNMQHKNITLHLIQFCTILKQHLKSHRPIVLPLKKVTGQMSTGQLSTGKLSTGQFPPANCPGFLPPIQTNEIQGIGSSVERISNFCQKFCHDISVIVKRYNICSVCGLIWLCVFFFDPVKLLADLN